MIKGCDISHWQGSVNFDELRPAADFAILKASEGTGYRDPRMAGYRDNARRVGMMVGYYHFARPNYGNSAHDEAQYFMQTIEPKIQDGEMLALDFEVPYRNAVSWCKEWLDYVASNMNGCKPLIYMDQSRLNGYDWTDVVAAGYGLWIAKYDNNPDAIPPSGQWSFAAMKQYTSSATFPGISGRVDANAFYGSHDAFKKYGYYRPTDNSGGDGGNGTDPCKSEKAEILTLKSTIQSMKTDFDEKLAVKDAELLKKLTSYKQKVSAELQKTLDNIKEEV